MMPARARLPNRRPSHVETLEVSGQIITACVGFDPATGAECMATSYLWRLSKCGQRVHIENPETGRAYCQAENCSGGKLFDGRGTEIPDGRRVCANCIDLTERDRTDYRESSLAVLLGERLAEEGPELFASGAVPKRPKRGKQVWPAHRSKGSRPKRSTVKYPRPFDDDLPW